MSDHRPRIFVVEDQRLIAADLEATLVRLGYEVAGTAAEAPEAVEKVLAARPDLVLMDIRLRGELDGIEAARRIREKLDVPVVYLTAYADEETILRAKVTSPFGYLVKPFNERELRAAIEVALYRHQTERLLADERARRRELQEQLLARDEFLRLASHELKTPLTPLLLQLETLQRSLHRAGLLEARVGARIERAMRQTHRLSQLVESMLEVGRITSGRFTLAPEPADLAQLVHEVAGRYQGEARTAGSTLLVRAEPPLAGVWDRERVEQILSNLVSNAIKYGSAQPVEIDAGGDEETVRVSVTDHGLGIEPEALERLFARFERGVSSRHFGGLGLGLFLARHFAVAHGGTLVGESRPGQGSTFTLVLPRAAAPAA